MVASTSVFAASKKSIVCTTFPEYDWVMNILGEKATSFDVTLLQNNGTDLHSYQPSVKDIAKISKADLFVYVGGESDEWVEKVLSQSVNKNQVAVNMLEVLGDKVREEEIVEGMQAEEEYEKNLAAYTKELAILDAEYKAAVKSAKKNTVLFGDRFPFRYLTDDYGLKYFATFVGCSAESEASFETVIFLVKKVDELGLNAVLTIEKSDKKIAKTVVGNTKNKKQEILEMDSLQSITTKEIKGGRNYLFS